MAVMDETATYRERRIWLLVVTGYAGLIPALSVLTRLTPICLPGLIDLDADLAALAYGVVPALIAIQGFCEAPRRHAQLLWLWLIGAILHLPDGPGFLPEFFQVTFIASLALLIVRRIRTVASPTHRMSDLARAIALLLLAVGAIVTAIGDGLHSQPLRDQGLAIGASAVMMTALLMAVAHRHSLLRACQQPAVILLAGALTLRLIAPYDGRVLTGASLMWLTGGVLLIRRTRIHLSDSR
jgi:hypothetical protein